MIACPTSHPGVRRCPTTGDCSHTADGCEPPNLRHNKPTVIRKGEFMRRSRHQDDDSIAARLKRAGVSRRDFIGFCGKLMVAAPFGLAITNHLTPAAVAAE